MSAKKTSPTGKGGVPRASPPKLKGATQFERFVETAKALEADVSGRAFDRAIGIVLAPKLKRPPQKSG